MKKIAVAAVVAALGSVSLAAAAPPASKYYSARSCHIDNVSVSVPQPTDQVVKAYLTTSCTQDNPKQYFFIQIATPVSGTMQNAPVLSDTTVMAPVAFNAILDSARSSMIHKLEVDFSGTGVTQGNGYISIVKLNDFLEKRSAW